MAAKFGEGLWMYRIAVVDDDREFSAKLREYLEQYAKENDETF